LYGPTYLLLVTFLTAPIGNPQLIAQLRAISDSPYRGIAVRFVDAYDRSPGPSLEDARRITRQLTHAAGSVEIWPWIFFNRFVGYEEGKKALDPAAQRFRDIKGFDLLGKSGAQAQFIDTWSTVLSIAKEQGLPGVVVDPELYNNYSLNSVAALAHAEGIPQDQAVSLLRDFGRHLGRIADRTCPSCRIHFLLTGYTRPQSWLLQYFHRNRSITYIILGIAETAKHNVFFDGAESSVGYCHTDTEDLRRKLSNRREQLTDLQVEYPNIRPAAPLVVWNQKSSNKRWLAEWQTCRKSTFETIHSFLEPYKLLASENELIWIYAASASDYNPFDSATAADFHDLLRSAANPGQ